MQHVGGVFSVYNERGEQLARAHNYIQAHIFGYVLTAAIAKSASSYECYEQSGAACFLSAMVIGTFGDAVTDGAHYATPPQGTPSRYYLNLSPMTATVGDTEVVTSPIRHSVQDGVALLQASFTNHTGSEVTFDGVGIVWIPYYRDVVLTSNMAIVTHADVTGAVPAGESCLVQYEISLT